MKTHHVNFADGNRKRVIMGTQTDCFDFLKKCVSITRDAC